MNPNLRLVVGVALIAIGIGCGLLGASIGWKAIQRWQAVNEVGEAQSLLAHGGRLDDARRLAERAAAHAPDEALPALLAADLGKPEGVATLLALAGRTTDRGDRQTLLATVAVVRALAGKPVEVDLSGTGDGRLIAAIVAARSGKAVGKLAATDEDPPHLAIERAAFTVLTRSAWEAGRIEDVRRYAGALVLLEPRAQHLDAQIAGLLLAALDPGEKSRSVDTLRIAGELPAAERGRILRAVVALAPERRELLATMYAKDLEAAP